MKAPLVSIITPFLNGGKFLSGCIESVLAQTYAHWELLLINDGSIDNSEEIVRSFIDPRIRYFTHENKGVSASRNVGLSEMNGDFFCFLDVDDEFTSSSLKSRLQIFGKDDKIHFVDGVVYKMDAQLNEIRQVWTPSCKGMPLEDLVRLTGNSFFGPSWMIKRKSEITYKFREGLTHLEDLLFYLQLAKEGGEYAYTSETILHYRMHEQSAMRNIDGLVNGYREVYDYLKEQEGLSPDWLQAYRTKVNRILSRSYIRKLNPLKAITARIR